MNLTSPVKRTTIFCRDVEKSLKCYRDILGFDVVDDKRVAGRSIARMIGLDDCSLRIIHLQSEGNGHGLIGLYAIEEGQTEELPIPAPGGIRLGQVAVVVQTRALNAINARIVEEGYPIITPSIRYVKSEPSGYVPAGTYTELIFLDPDGVAVNVVDFAPA